MENKLLILGSSSPRRQFLLKEVGFEFSIAKPLEDESFPPDMGIFQVAKYLAEKKASSIALSQRNAILITADTVVILGNKLLNKPQNENEAIEMLKSLSGKTHGVITGVCLMDEEKKMIFDDTTWVTFKNLTQEEIEFYVRKHKPFDKAGAYGAQDWIGMVAIEKIEGSYFNVMGLPIHKVHQHLMNW